MAFARPLTTKEQNYIITWQYAKTAGGIASDLNNWPENREAPRTPKCVRDFLYRRRRMSAPEQE